MDTPDFLDDGGHLALLGQAIALNRPISDESAFSLFSTEGGWSQTKSAGMEFASRPFKSPIAFRMGIVAERESLLRSSASGAFGRMSGNSAFIGLEGQVRVGSWNLSAGGEVGTVVADVDESLLSINSSLITSAFALRAERKLNHHNTVSFAVSQPVRIESGSANYTVPIGRTPEGDVLRTSNSVDLEPSARQIDLGVKLRRALHSDGDFRMATRLSFHPGHTAAAKPEFSVLAGLRLRF